MEVNFLDQLPGKKNQLKKDFLFQMKIELNLGV